MTALDSSSLKFWEVVGLWGFIFVWVGVAGEGVEIFIKLFQRKLYERKKFCLDVIGAVFWIVLVIGLAVEFLGNVKAMRIADSINSRLDAEAGQARQNAGAAIELAAQIGTTNAQLSLRVEELRSANLALELKLQPRRITAQQRDKFIELLKEAPKCPVKVFVGREDDETANYAKQVREILDSAGYGTGKDNDIISLPYLSHISPIGDPTTDFPFEIAFYGTAVGRDNSDVNWPGLKIIFDNKNQVTTITILSRDVSAAPGFINKAFNEIGIRPAIGSCATTTSALNLKPGEWGVFVFEKF
jgi:hypothetical protein